MMEIARTVVTATATRPANPTRSVEVIGSLARPSSCQGLARGGESSFIARRSSGGWGKLSSPGKAAAIVAPVYHAEVFYGRWRALPGDRAFRQRRARSRRPAQDVLGAERQSEGRAGGLPPWRTGSGGGAGPSALLRSGPLSHRRLRSARRRPLGPARRDYRQHHG